jgi:hypothetical protein
MKKTIKLIGTVLLVLAVVFTLTTCSDGRGGGGGSGNGINDKDKDKDLGPVKHADYYGTWVGGSQIFTISETSLTWKNTNLNTYVTWSLDTVTAVTNTGSNKADYPNGFEFAGKVTAIDGTWTLGTYSVSSVGEDCLFALYMHTGKGMFSTPGGNIYIKQ